MMFFFALMCIGALVPSFVYHNPTIGLYFLLAVWLGIGAEHFKHKDDH